jgi:uncharacterized protein (TIGR00251 family)
MPIQFSEREGSVSFVVRVIPRASKSEIAGELDGALKVRLTAPPVDGAANEELIRLLAKRLGASRSGVRITAGESSKTKRITVAGLTLQEIADVLQPKSERDIFSVSK